MGHTLTIPSEKVEGQFYNIDKDLVVCKGDLIIKADNMHFIVVELLGKGSFGQVFRCVSNNGDEVAIKVVKNDKRYFSYEVNEIKILSKIKNINATKHIVEFRDAFCFKGHLCIVEEVLSKNLYDITRFLKFTGMGFSALRHVIEQVLIGLETLSKLGMMHCDIKPENILLRDPYQYDVKIIDFGSSSLNPYSKALYIQSRFYRAPEVILGIPYGAAIDIWSLGCMTYELFTGDPLFPGKDNYDQIHRINEFFPTGLPRFMLEYGKETQKYFEKENNFRGRKNPDKFTKKDMVNKINEYSENEREAELVADFIIKAIDPSYIQRMNATVLLTHPMFTEELNEEVVDKKRDIANPIPPKNPKSDRKKSCIHLGFFNDEIIKKERLRKTSVFNYSDAESTEEL